MSAKDIPKACIVVDTSIARSASGPDSTHPIGCQCRDFLMTLRKSGHRIAMGERLRAEWLKHQSNFAILWLSQMTSVNKVRDIDDFDDTFDAEVDFRISDEPTALQVKKDSHLAIAAIRTDSRVASCDDTIRRHFAKSFRHCSDVMAIIWVNPTVAEENSTVWLENGAPNEPDRQLKRY
jgi:hypothetical protein